MGISLLNYECENQMSIFDMISKPFSIDKPIRLIELFAGVGSQAMALRNIGADFEHYRVVEFDKYAIASYNAIHGTDFPTMDVTKIHGSDCIWYKSEIVCLFCITCSLFSFRRSDSNSNFFLCTYRNHKHFCCTLSFVPC